MKKLLASLALGLAAFASWGTVEVSPQYPADLNEAYPAANDPRIEGDDHLRNSKTVIKNIMPGYSGALSVTAADTGSANAYILTPSRSLPSYTSGTLFVFKALNANTGASTLNVSGLGVKSIKTISGADPGAGEIYGEVILRYDGTNMVLVGGSGFLAKTGGAQTVTGTVTFTTGPTVPTAAIGTSSTQAASTAFVAGTAFSSALPAQTGNAGKFVTTDGTTASWGPSGLEVYEERASTAAQLVSADASRKIKYTGAGGYTLSIDTYSNLTAGWRTRVWNGTTSYIELTADGATFRMYPGEERELYRDSVNSRIGSVVLRKFRFRTTSAGAGTIVMMPGYNHLGVRATGSGAGGGGGGGGGSGRGSTTSSGSGGSGGSGGAAGQNAQSVVRRIPFTVLPAVGSTAAYSVGAAGAKGTGGAGGAGAASGGAGIDGSDGVSGSAGNATTFGGATDAYYISAPGGGAGTNRGLKGLGGVNSQAGGAAVTNNAAAVAGSINERGAVISANALGPASTAGTNQTSAAPGTAGGAGGDTPAGVISAPRLGATFAAGGAANSGAVPSAGNNGTSPAAETNPGVGGLGGGGGGGSPGVGAGPNAATGAGGTGGNGADGGPGEIEIWGE